MKWFIYLLNFYIKASIYVAIAMACLVKITQIYFKITNENSIVWFCFFGTIFGYNFIKYSDFILRRKKTSLPIKSIFAFSIFSLAAALYFFFFIESIAKTVIFFFAVCVFLYTFSFSKKHQNIRNWAGFKIYFVCFCWTSISVLLPVLNYKIPISTDFWIYFLERFLVIFSLLLLFEIGDLKFDSPKLKTIPQQIGVKKTKILGYLILLIYLVLKLQFIVDIEIAIAIVIAIFLFFSSENRSKYYTLFWVESIPILWLILKINWS